MKKNLIIGLLFAIMAIGFSACDEDGWDTDNAPFLGSWYGVNNNSGFTFYSNGSGWYSDDYGNTTSFSWDYDSDDLDIYVNDSYDSFWEYAWSFTPEGYLALYDLDYGVTTYYSR